MNYEVIKQQLGTDEVVNLLKEGTICTPLPLVEEIVEKLPVQWDNPNLKILDPVCGRGVFLFVIKNKLLQAGHSEQHIIENMLYGVDIAQQNVDVTVAVLDPEYKYKNNIECADALAKDYKNMKFDVIVGNPPYQDSTTLVKGSRGNLWQKFVFAGFDLLKPEGSIAFVTPDSWLQFRGKIGTLLKSNQLTHVWTSSHVNNYFDVGVTISAWIATKKAPTCTTLFVNENKTMDLRSVDMLSNTSVEATSILQKVLVPATDGIQFETDSQNNVSWKNDPQYSHLYAEEQSNSRPWRVCHTARIDCYAANKPKDYDKKKVILPLMTKTPRPRFFDGGIGSVSRMSVHYNVKSNQEGNNLVTLLTRKVYQFVCHVTNNRNSMTRDWLRQLPKLDLSRSWTDEELYKYFNLTQEEIKLIEDTIK